MIRRFLACATIAIGVLVGASAPAFAAAADEVTPDTATGCSHNTFGNPLVCIHVDGTGLHVNFATVTNVGAPTGHADISNSGSGVTHQST